MSSDRIKLVQGDTRPLLIVSLTDPQSGAAIDVSDPAATVRLLFRAEGSDAAAVITATKLAGFDPTGAGEQVDTTPPYDAPGRGGRVQFSWPSDALAGEPGNYEGEVKITFGDGTTQTVYELMKFKLRPQF